MAVGTGINCRYCGDFAKQRCDGKATDCLCRDCPRNMGQCLCVKYCRETESILTVEEDYDNLD